MKTAEKSLKKEIEILSDRVEIARQIIDAIVEEVPGIVDLRPVVNKIRGVFNRFARAYRESEGTEIFLNYVASPEKRYNFPYLGNYVDNSINIDFDIYG